MNKGNRDNYFKNQAKKQQRQQLRSRKEQLQYNEALLQVKSYGCKEKEINSKQSR